MEDTPTQDPNEEQPHEGETSQEPDIKSDHEIPQGSQYESEQEDDPLEEYEEYIEVEDSNDEEEDRDIVYLHSARETNKSSSQYSESGDENSSPHETRVNGAPPTTPMVNGHPNMTRMLAASENTSSFGDAIRPTTEIPFGITPFGLMEVLPDENRVLLFVLQKKEHDPEWDPPPVGSNNGQIHYLDDEIPVCS